MHNPVIFINYDYFQEQTSNILLIYSSGLELNRDARDQEKDK